MMKLGEQTKMDAQEKRKEKNVSHSSHKHHTERSIRAKTLHSLYNLHNLPLLSSVILAGKAWLPRSMKYRFLCVVTHRVF